jgi:transposase
MRFRKWNSHCLGIAAGGILRLLLPTRTYQGCKGGATLLTHYAAINGTGVDGPFYYAADGVGIWQVCDRKTKEMNR